MDKKYLPKIALGAWSWGAGAETPTTARLDTFTGDMMAFFPSSLLLMTARSPDTL